MSWQKRPSALPLLALALVLAMPPAPAPGQTASAPAAGTEAETPAADAAAPSAGASPSGAAPPTDTGSSVDWQATVDQPAADENRKKLEEQQKSLELSRKQESIVEQIIEQLTRERSQLTDKLVATARDVQQSEMSLTEVEQRLKGLEEQKKAKQDGFHQRRSELYQLLAALQRMGRNPPPVVVTERSDALDMVRSAMLLAKVYPQVASKAEELAHQLADLDKVIASIKEESARRQAEATRLADEQAHLAELLKAKHEELASRGTELTKLRDLVAEQAKSVANLSELIDRSDRAVAFKGTLGDPDKQLAELQPPPEPEAPPPAAEAPSVPASQATRVAPDSQALARLNGVFERQKGSVPLPVLGRRVVAFGDLTRNVGRSKGELFTARSNAQITSPCNGLVVYAGDFRSFGQILIINAGGGYHVLLAGLGRLDVVTGQTVAAGEPVGRMAETGSGGASDAAASAPYLYVEFRSKDKPINPGPWWAGDSQKVQG